MSEINQSVAAKQGRSNGLLVLVGLIALLLAILLSWQSWNYIRLRVETAFAEEQTRIFEESRVKALTSGTKEAAELLDYIQYYYPPGSKQRTGSHLDRVVERARAAASREVIQHLQQKTGEDFGENPEPWIKKFSGNK